MKIVRMLKAGFQFTVCFILLLSVRYNPLEIIQNLPSRRPCMRVTVPTLVQQSPQRLWERVRDACRQHALHDGTNNLSFVPKLCERKLSTKYLLYGLLVPFQGWQTLDIRRVSFEQDNKTHVSRLHPEMMVLLTIPSEYTSLCELGRWQTISGAIGNICS
jgi:hypothetical protein